MCVRAARDRARMWQIGPRISSAYGLLRSTPIIVLRALGGAQPTNYFHDVRTVDAIDM